MRVDDSDVTQRFQLCFAQNKLNKRNPINADSCHLFVRARPGSKVDYDTTVA